MFFNKKGIISIWIIGTIVIVFFVAYILITYSGKTIKDAGDEFDSLLNLHTADCDHDHDGLKDKEDVCPCNDDDFFDSRTYYVAGTRCQTKRRCKDDSKGDIKRFSECSSSRTGTEIWEYYIDLKSGECEKWFNSEGKKKITNTYRNECRKHKITSQEVAFSQTCADKILAKHKVTGKFTFTCKTSTRACKKILKEPC